MFRDQPVAFPNDNPMLDHFTAEFLKANGEVVYRSMHHALTDVKRANAVHVCHEYNLI